MKVLNFCFNVIFLIVSFSSFGQQRNYPNKNLASFNPVLLQMIIIPEENIFHQNQQTNLSRNNVFIRQVGDGNHTNASINAATSSTTNLEQNGNSNCIDITANLKSIQGTVVQNGNHNYSFTFANDSGKDLLLNVDQNGDGHHFESHGTNSIGNKLKFEMTGDSKSIIVRNFK